MRYFGGKARIAKPLTAFLNSQLKPGQPFVDLFCGSCNVISLIDPNRQRIANDIHKELIALHKHVQVGGELPSIVTEDEYAALKADRNGNVYPDWLKGFVGFGCSYSGKWWGGYARGGEDRNYALNAKNTLEKKHHCLKDVQFFTGSYSCIDIPSNSLVYCDIPYKESVGYSCGSFDHEKFYEWASDVVESGHELLVSEYSNNVPVEWEIVWQCESKKDIRDKNGVQQKTIEVLCRPKK